MLRLLNASATHASCTAHIFDLKRLVEQRAETGSPPSYQIAILCARRVLIASRRVAMYRDGVVCAWCREEETHEGVRFLCSLIVAGTMAGDSLRCVLFSRKSADAGYQMRN